MLINVTNEKFNIPDGTYTAEIKAFLGYNDDTKVLVKLALDNGDVLVKTYDADEVGGQPWNSVFKALNTNDTDDLVGKMIEIEVKNNTSKKTGLEFSNIRKVRMIDD